jgi:ferredoxin
MKGPLEMYKIPQYDLPDAFNRIAGDMPLYVPLRGEAGAAFSLWRGDMSAVDLQTLTTVLSPKGFFLPPAEGLYKTALANDTYEIMPQPLPDRPFALFGVRACDAAAIGILDGIFLGESVDPSYKARRDASCIITLACESPAATCFCGTFGIDPAKPGGDVTAWLRDGFLYWRPQTEKGESLTQALAQKDNPFENGWDGKCEKNLSTEVKTPSYHAIFNHYKQDGGSRDLFDSPAWDNLHRTCIACGTCTFLCPTCQCYDISDFEAGGAVHCHRQWDACLYPEFTQMAHGNPRPTKKERFRQRFMHKLAYHPQKYGVCGCVGCGRCVSKCPVGLNIVKVAKSHV